MPVPAAFYSDVPPSIDGTLTYAISIFGLLGATLIALEWLSRTVWAMIDRPYPVNHPITVTRMVWGLFLLSTVLRVAPDVVATMMWPDVQPVTRYLHSRVNRVLDGVAMVPMMASWGLALVGSVVTDFQLVRRPIPVDLWPSWSKMKRPIAIGVTLIFISFVLALPR